MKKILYYNNCWFTNVGEAFLDIGGMKLIREIFGEQSRLACISGMTDYYVENAKHLNYFSNKITNYKINHGHSFELSDYLDADYVVLPGMFGTQEFLKSKDRKRIDELARKGVRVIFLGIGGWNYNDKEADEFRKYLCGLNPALIVSRDDYTYDLYKDYANCVKGIDCAFWTKNSFDPRGFVDKEYVVHTFNRSKEPSVFVNENSNVVKPFHMQYLYKKEDYYENIFISDTPYDYLTLYANAKEVYTDLVHATIISLQYQVPVRFFSTDKRALAIDALENVYEEDGFLHIDEENLEKQKSYIITKIQNAI